MPSFFCSNTIVTAFVDNNYPYSVPLIVFEATGLNDKNNI